MQFITARGLRLPTLDSELFGINNLLHNSIHCSQLLKIFAQLLTNIEDSTLYAFILYSHMKCPVKGLRLVFHQLKPKCRSVRQHITLNFYSILTFQFKCKVWFLILKYQNFNYFYFFVTSKLNNSINWTWRYNK